MSTIEHTSTLRVRYADTDKMGIVYYGKYFEYFEFARTEMLRECGLPYALIEEAGYALPVLEASAKYAAGAKYDDLLRITARMIHEGGPRLRILYDVTREANGEHIAKGETTLGFVQRATGRPSRPPAVYLEAIENYLTTHSIRAEST